MPWTVGWLVRGQKCQCRGRPPTSPMMLCHVAQACACCPRDMAVGYESTNQKAIKKANTRYMAIKVGQLCQGSINRHAREDESDGGWRPPGRQTKNIFEFAFSLIAPMSAQCHFNSTVLPHFGFISSAVPTSISSSVILDLDLIFQPQLPSSPTYLLIPPRFAPSS